MGPNCRAFRARISAAISWVVRSPATYRSKTAVAASVGSRPSSRTDATARATRAWRSVRSWSAIGLMAPAMNTCLSSILPWRRQAGIYLPQFGVRSEVNVYVGEREARVTFEKQMWRHALVRAAPRLVSAPAGLRNKGRDESRPGTLKRAPPHLTVRGSLDHTWISILHSGWNVSGKNRRFRAAPGSRAKRDRETSRRFPSA